MRGLSLPSPAPQSRGRQHPLLVVALPGMLCCRAGVPAGAPGLRAVPQACSLGSQHVPLTQAAWVCRGAPIQRKHEAAEVFSNLQLIYSEVCKCPYRLLQSSRDGERLEESCFIALCHIPAVGFVRKYFSCCHVIFKNHLLNHFEKHPLKSGQATALGSRTVHSAVKAVNRAESIIDLLYFSTLSMH